MSVIHRSVLIVDDDKSIRLILAKWLTIAGYEVAEAENGEQALTLIQENCPNFLITDWEMPVMDGMELCSRIRELALPQYLYTIFVTGRCSSDDMTNALEAGADDFVTKPVDRGEILARLRSGSRVLEMERRLNLLANSDPLTGLYTKRIFNEQLQTEWARGTRHGRDLSCVILDIDFFKRINDTHGHPAGDEVLRGIAKLMTQNCRTSDILCRYGGEEFCIVLPETDEEDAAMWADRLRQAIGRASVSIEKQTLRVTASFGVAQMSDDLQEPVQLIERADQCLLVAKESGRDRVVRYAQSQQQALLRGQSSPDQTMGFDGVLARDVMTSIVAGLKADCTVDRVADYFVNLRINSAPVVDDRGKMVGIVSEKDLMNEMLKPNTWSTPVRELMKPNVISYEDDTPVLMIYEFLCRVSIRSVIIVRDAAPVGFVSRGSLLRWFNNRTSAVRSPGRFASDELQTNPSAIPQWDGQCLKDTAAVLVEQARSLFDSIRDNSPDELLPRIVGGVSRIQELANDLLAETRVTNVAASTTAGADGSVLSGSHV